MKKNIVVGVTGGIACYKAVEIVNALVKKGYEVHVIMTENATRFVTPLTFQTLSNHKVAVNMFDEVDKWDTEHISLAQEAEIFLIAPATANVIGKIANGIADDMLTTTVMATRAPVLIAPAMNTAMWENPIIQNNVKVLKSYGYEILDTDVGRLACGDIGSGKLLSWEKIVERIEEISAAIR
ncbi:MAG: bifunctional phosphopantothenoylcysteine decarboxylase/phosphopantothenate--cysteine ligase CoaBC [Firmicutes bacterium HGW-Firmicutes-1]|jgi:phosphopantothenoylcysteine decarboxylase/phosphopantothenate--cysteine ligase|nr:MAG: bifunctional phosphopantothenoylcysteine decarboxylase/phosphopantothenate--cysteine ligase CoaBC [Firmicutes bacterium HGW-Firmicutes-1]